MKSQWERLQEALKPAWDLNKKAQLSLTDLLLEDSDGSMDQATRHRVCAVLTNLTVFVKEVKGSSDAYRGAKDFPCLSCAGKVKVVGFNCTACQDLPPCSAWKTDSCKRRVADPFDFCGPCLSRKKSK